MEILQFLGNALTHTINTVTAYPWPSFIVFLILLTIFACRRRVRYEGVQETVRGNNKRMWTDSVTGTTFPTDSRIIGIGELATRRRKFGKAVWSWALTAIVVAGTAITLAVISNM